MLIFTIEIIPEFETRQRVYKLVRNGKCHIDEFWIEVKKDQHLVTEGRVIWKILEDVANGERLPKTRYRKLKLRYNVYEVKSKELRIYLLLERNTGLLLILGGRKSDQKQDLKRLRMILDEYVNSKLRK